jgi:hypothetical protein
VFISYAHNDDDIYAQEARGWVTQLHLDVEQRVRNYLGSDTRIWRDCEIRNNDDFTNKIIRRLAHTAIFLSVLSPSFLKRMWCQRELETFTSTAENNLGVLIENEKSRIFKVEKMPVGRDQLPAAMQGTKSYRFYQSDPGEPKRLHELRPLLGGDYSRRYFEEMDELAKDIAALLTHMIKPAVAEKDESSRRPVVYVAEATFDLEDRVGALRRDLKDRGYVVLPEGDLPHRASDYGDKVRACLKKAMLSIHLIGPHYGFVPEGDTRSNVWLQHDLALERAKDPAFFRLIWMPGDVGSPDERQQRFIEHLKKDPQVQTHADLLNGDLEELKTIIHEKLDAIRNRLLSLKTQESPPGASASQTAATGRSSDEPLRVYIICDRLDRKSPSLVALRQVLYAQGWEGILPTESDDPGVALQAHTEKLCLCDACVIYYGAGSPEWFESKLMDLRKLLRGREKPVLAKAIYIVPPETEHKSEVVTLEATVLRGPAEFSPAAIEPFLQKLR